MARAMTTERKFEFALRMGDNCLILAQGVSAWCGHAPAVEEDIALANTALDLIGQTKLWLAYAGDIEGKGRSADELAFLRDVREFRNCLLVEQPNGDYGQTLMRQYLFDAWHYPMLNALMGSCDAQIAAIAEKSVKEAAYQIERSRDLVIRLGDGDDDSHAHMQNALDALWRFAGELTTPDAVDKALAADGVAPDLAAIAALYAAETRATFDAAALIVPETPYMQQGGKSGLHSEALGHLLADMQWLQRAFPGAKW